MSIGNRVEQTTTSTGTGSIELLAPPTGRRSFLQEFGAGATVRVVGVKYDAAGGGRFRVIHPCLDGTSEVEPTGTVKMHAGASAPPGYLLCQGQAVSRATYAALFAVIGAGDGSTTFNLPDLRDRMPMGASASRALGSIGGSFSATTASAGIHDHGPAAVPRVTITMVGPARRRGRGGRGCLSGLAGLRSQPARPGRPRGRGTAGAPRHSRLRAGTGVPGQTG
jgi:hypothetical protein